MKITKSRLIKIIKEELAEAAGHLDLMSTGDRQERDTEALTADDELGIADSPAPRSPKERLLAMLLAREDIDRLRAEFADDPEMQQELDRIEANPFYDPQGAYRQPKKA